MPDQKRPRGVTSHKNPDCRCGYCSARRRKEEAIALAVRPRETGLITESDPNQEVVNASDPDSHKRIVTNRKGYKLHVQQWLALRALNPDITNTEAAERIGIVRTTLQHSIRRAVDEGWLVFTDPLEQVDYQIVPKVVKNLNYFLDQQDHKVTIETAKGVLFPAYRESKGIHENVQTVLALKIEMPAAVPDVIDITPDTQIIGQPKDLTIEAENENEP